MPIFEFKCLQCGRDFDELIRASADEGSASCPECHSKRVERKLSVFATGSAARPAPSGGGCGRCGDPNGPCGTSF